MKHKFGLLAVLPLLLLSSCDFAFFTSDETKNVVVYDLDKIEDNDNLNAAKQQEIKAVFRKNKEHVPYVSLKQYASLYNSRFVDGVKSSVRKESFSSVLWTIYVGEDPYFVSEISVFSKEILVAGSIESVLKGEDNPIDTGALLHGLKTEYEGKFLSSRSYATYSFEDHNVDYVSLGGEFYFPLTFLDLTFSGDSGVYFYYNYASIYATHDVDNYSAKSFKIDNKSYTVDSQMKERNTLKNMPEYLKQLNANMFFYLIDNFYGLKEEKGFSSMKDLCIKTGLYKYFFDDNPLYRAQAYADAVSYFDDNHTAIVSANDTWGENTFGNFQYATGCINRSLLRNQNTITRNTSYELINKKVGDIVLSADGTVAMYVMDSFSFGTSEEVFNEDGSINYEKARAVDTFYDLVYVLNSLKGTSVKWVALDISTNGGGVVGVLMKILCLISKDNKSYFHYYDSNTTQLAIAESQIDINGDGVYDQDDCFGDDFNFCLLTSDCSFSCGNALPCYAKQFGTAKIIGGKSGGGECAVGIHYLPNSQYVYHSSSMHIGYYDEKNQEFKGFEGGATPDYDIKGDYVSLYDIESINSIIKGF